MGRGEAGAGHGAPLNFHQSNLHKSKIANLFLEKTIPKNSKFVSLLTEPYNFAGKFDNLYQKILSFQKKNEIARAAIYCDKGQPAWPIAEKSCKDVAVAKFQYGPDSFIAISAYWDILSKELPPNLISSIAYAKSLNLPFVVGMDANAHSRIFGSKDQNARGDTLDDFIIAQSLIAFNKGDAPTFCNSRGHSSVIDVTFGCSEMANLISKWKVHTEEDNLSDHNRISFSLTPKSSFTGAKTRVRKYQNIDWEKFGSTLDQYLIPIKDEMLKEFFTYQQMDALATTFNQAIIRTLDKVAPLKEVKQPNKIARYWDDDCEEAWQELQDGGHLTRADAKENLRYYVEKAKRESYQRFINGAETTQEAALISKMAKGSPICEIGLLKKNDDTYTKTPEESLLQLTSKCFPNFITVDKGHKPNYGFVGPFRMEKIHWLSMHRLERVLEDFSTHKSAGPDQIKPIVLQNLTQLGKEFLLNLITASISCGLSPQSWLESRVTYIPKPGKSNYNSINSFRPITLANYTLKTVEKLCLWRIQETSLTNKPFHKSQHAFRSGHSTETAALELTSKIQHHIDKKQFCLAVFLDFKGAFDTLKFSSVINAMKKRNVNFRICNWYENFLYNRKVTIENKGITLVIHPQTGEPQGGVMSAPGWNFPMDELLELIEELEAEGFAFADDLSLLIGGDHLGRLIPKMNIALKIVEKWAQRHGLELATEKCVSIIFTRKTKYELPNIAPQINGVTIKYVKETKYLGLILDSRLNWSKHLLYIKQKAKNYFYLIKNSLNPKWGPHHTLIRWLYLQCVRPMISYCSIAWAPMLFDKQSKIDFFRTIQRPMLARTGFYRDHTPTKALEVILNVEPLHLHIKRTFLNATVRHWQRVLELSRKFGPNAPASHLMGMLYKSQIIYNELRLIDLCPRDIVSDRRFEINIGQGLDAPYKGLSVFTDGSKIKGEGAGFGVVIMWNEAVAEEHSFKMSDDQSIYNAELSAIFWAAERCLERAIPHPDPEENVITFFSDSRSVLQSLLSHRTKSSWVFQTYKMLNKLAAKFRVVLNWIRAHNEFNGNELADKAAKGGATSSSLPILGDIPLPMSYFKAKISSRVLEDWNAEWANDPICRRTKIFFPKVDAKKANDMLKIRSKSTFSQLVRCITWFSGLKDYNYKIDPKNTLDPFCRSCGDEIESTAHLVANCPKLNWLRLEAFQCMQMDDGNIEWEVSQLAHFLSNKYIKALEHIPDEYNVHFADYNHLLSIQTMAESARLAWVGPEGDDTESGENRLLANGANQSAQERSGIG